MHAKGATIIDYLMIVAVIVAVAIPIVRIYFGDRLTQTFGRNREKLVSFIGQERKKPVPNAWFNRERTGPNAPGDPGPGAGTPDAPGDGPNGGAGPGGQPGGAPNSAPDSGPDPANPDAPGSGPDSGPNSVPNSGPRSGPRSGPEKNRPSPANRPGGDVPGPARLRADENPFDSGPKSPNGPTTSRQNEQANTRDSFFRTVGGSGAGAEESLEGDLTRRHNPGMSTKADTQKAGAISPRDPSLGTARPGDDGSRGRSRWSWWFLIRFLLLLFLLLVLVYIAIQSLRRR